MQRAKVETKWSAATYAAVAAFAASLLFGMLLPIYTDEIGWRFQARSALDGGVDRAIGINCGLNTLAVPPLFMLPLRHATAAFNLWLADPFYVRLTGVVCAFAWGLMLLFLIGNVARDRLERTTLTLLAFALLGFGVLPLLMVMSRPEQPILLTVTAALMAAAAAWYRDGAGHSRAQAVIRSLLVVLLGGLALGFHLKGVVYMPVFLVCALLSSRGHDGRLARLTGAAALIGLTVVAVPYWVHRFQCPSDPVIAALLARNSLAASLAGPGSLAGKLGIALAGFDPFSYVGLIFPRDAPMSGWLPADRIGRAGEIAWGVIIQLAWGLALLFAAVCLLRPLLDAGRRLHPDAKVILPLALAAVAAIWGATQVGRNVYEAALALPVATIFIVFAIRSAALSDTDLRRARIGAAFIAGLSLCSQAAIAASYARPFFAISRSPGVIADQNHSISAYGYGAVGQRILTAAKTCGIDPKSNPHGLLIDDLTYFPFMRSARPLHRLGVISVWNGQIDDPVAYLRAHRSSGLVMACAYLPPRLRARTHRTSDFCCMGPSDWGADH